ncbi:hypothetical protein SAMN05421812_101280 [Asanoa hainanensis]|uniref:NACHT N-terminal Helical domain-containing protein n=1 Tax=Asanoa hainanensis TaxID=560556 RepID=A0A239G8T1_9ACTN|nr:hypothetical protein [Asanoa hainanensis]SNS65577.1 hypothetical protein SAMN05421812_101280 [Asanoa hainanensis]
MAQGSVGFADAVQLVGGTGYRIGRLVVPSGATSVSDVLAWFDADDARPSEGPLEGFASGLRGLPRYDRTRRIEAAHAVLVVTAFFDSLRDVRLPDLLSDRASTVEASELPGYDGLVKLVDVAVRFVPNPLQPAESREADLHRYYLDLADRMHEFVSGLAAWDPLPAPERNRITRELTEAADRAIDRYRDSLARLAAEVPEVGFWIMSAEHSEIRSALASLRESLGKVSFGAAPNDRRREYLARAYQTVLERPVVNTGVADGIVFPTLERGYVSPLFRAAAAPPAAPVSDERWWAEQPVREDLDNFVRDYLTSSRAVQTPLLVLGQPGSGKSVLTLILAARLAATDFMPIRVALRQTQADADIWEQVEEAIRETTGERITWPEWALSAGDALSVILLDGLDELIQATGVSQTDYLLKVARFQQRELVQGRPVAVIVTSRTVVADRARRPEETMALHLEPFDERRVTEWLAVWNESNAGAFADRGLTPLEPATLRAYPELAEQPLLLLMLAIYDAGDNDLQRRATDLRHHELYERLLWGFARREVEKRVPNLSEHDVRSAVEDEINKLSVVAMAMFNRGAQWVTDTGLDEDLAALGITSPERQPMNLDLRMPATAARLVLGRFFFVHRAQATRDDYRLETYEFLHATFGEYLVSRLTWWALRDVASRAASATRLSSFASIPIDDDLLRALLSFQPLSDRRDIVSFLAAFAAAEESTGREDVRNVLLTLFQRLDHTPPSSRYTGYQPTRSGEPTRYATYAVNLLLLGLCMGPVLAGELYPRALDPVRPWHAQTLFWRSQLSTHAWRGLVDAVALERSRDTHRREVRLTLGQGLDRPVIDPAWTLALDSDHPYVYGLLTGDRREAYFQCGRPEDVVRYALEPIADRLPLSLNTFVAVEEGELQSAAHALVKVWADPSGAAYRAATAVVVAHLPHWTDDDRISFGELLLSRLSTDGGASPATAADVLETMTEGASRTVIASMADGVLRCVLAFLGRSREVDHRLATLVTVALAGGLDRVDPILAVDALVRLHEQGQPVPLPPALQDAQVRRRVQEQITPVRPDLVARWRALPTS